MPKKRHFSLPSLHFPSFLPPFRFPPSSPGLLAWSHRPLWLATVFSQRLLLDCSCYYFKIVIWWFLWLLSPPAKSGTVLRKLSVNSEGSHPRCWALWWTEKPPDDNFEKQKGEKEGDDPFSFFKAFTVWVDDLGTQIS